MSVHIHLYPIIKEGNNNQRNRFQEKNNRFPQYIHQEMCNKLKIIKITSIELQMQSSLNLCSIKMYQIRISLWQQSNRIPIMTHSLINLASKVYKWKGRWANMHPLGLNVWKKKLKCNTSKKTWLLNGSMISFWRTFALS